MRRPTRRNTVEQIPENELAERREVAKLTALLQEKRKAFPTNQGEVLRGVHPKSHGCVDAKFVVNSRLPRELRAGLFRQPGKAYKAKIRYSNADVLILPDVLKDEANPANVNVNRSRGMALKILNVGQRTLLPDGGKANQDFLMINTPEFAFANVRDYLRLTRVLMLDEIGASPDLFFAPLQLAQQGLFDPATGQLAPAVPGQPDPIAHLRPAFGPGGPFEGFGAADFQRTLKSFQTVGKIQAMPVRNPLEVPYFGAAPFRFGRGKVMRLSVMPENAPAQKPFTAEEIAKMDPNYLAKALAGTVGRGEVRLSVRVQVAKIADIQDRVPELIEDATNAWDEVEFPQHDVAQIIIPQQRGDLVDACKGQFFTPWHSLAAHRPLGGINRLRRPVYNRSMAKRSGIRPGGRTSLKLKPNARLKVNPKLAKSATRPRRTIKKRGS